MKNKFITFCSLLLCFCLIALPLSAQAETSQAEIVFADNYTVNDGEILSIPVILSGNTGLMGFGFDINYDSNYLTPVSVETTKLTESGMLNDSIETANPGSFQVFWTSTQNMTENGEIFVLKFSASSNTNINSKISFTTLADDTFDEQYHDFSINSSDCDVTIVGNQTAPVQIALSYTSAQVGKELIITGTAASPLDTTSEIELNFDSELLSFVSIEGNGNHKVSDVNCDTAGKVHFTLTTDASGDKKLFELHLMCEAEFNRTTISGVVDGDFGYTIKSTTVLYKKSSAKIYSNQNIFGKLGEKISIPIYISDNQGIMGYKLIFQYDKSVLKPIGIKNSNLFTGYLEDSISDNSGEFFVIWCGTSDELENGKIFDIEFEVLTSNIDEATIKVSFSQEDTFDEIYNPSSLLCSDVVIKCDSLLIGDVNGDNEVTSKDVTVLRRYFAEGWDVEIVEDNCDINGDGFITTKDVTQLRRYLAGGWDVVLGKL